MGIITLLKQCATWIADMALRLQAVALQIARTWWRPIGCLSIVGGIITNYIVVPFQSHTPAGGEGFAAVIGAFASAMAVREWGKAQANQANQPGAQP